METKRKEALASSVFVEFYDLLGNSLAQAAYLKWRGKAVPAVGDSVCCTVAHASNGAPAKMTGRVRSRHFDVQTANNGSSSVLVRLTVDVVTAANVPPRRGPSTPPAMFSWN